MPFPETLRIATFNIENLDWAKAHEEEFARRLLILRPILEGLAADVLCLQEIGAQRPTAHAPRRFLALDRLLADGPYANFYRLTSTRPGSPAPADVHNLAILSRWPVAESRQLHHDLVSAWRWTPPEEGEAVEVAFDRPLLYARIETNGAALHVLNLHLRAPRPVPLSHDLAPGRAVAEGQFLAAQKREGQALEARLFIESLFDREPQARIVVCGDFNADAYETPTRILRGEDGADARRLEALEGRVAAAQRYSVIHAGRPAQIDHILASNALAADCVGAAILNEGLQDEVFAPEPIEGSLHAPLVATFRMG
ncbi:MAG TPA: endonuclease/exonuclease/phosphatase family protein [Methylocystis sp.]|nr:endonuclease/exonuclease/phosphatase family protein [Methylocystis sp.]